MASDILFLINGLGLGNSTRCHAVMQPLAERGHRIHVLTSGNGLKYFEAQPEVTSLTPMEAFFYSKRKGRISGWQTLLAGRQLLRLARNKRTQLEKVLAKIKPAAAVIDSEYAIGPLRRAGVPIVALNNSEVVVSEYLRWRDNPRSVRSQFWFIEFPDYLFHRAMCDLVLSPSPHPGQPRHPKFRRVGLIVRRAVREAARTLADHSFPLPREIRNVVFMLSGSMFASAVPLDTFEEPFHIDVVGREGPSTPRVTYHGRLLHNLPLLVQADALVINGGYSAVSEALALNKPTFVLPVAGHAEQYVNARLVADLGRGYSAHDETVMDVLLGLYRTNAWSGLHEPQPLSGLDGAENAAGAIDALLATR
jgi:UDP:flavonoid glycosyltransferase YjiC (YdhE family)